MEESPRFDLRLQPEESRATIGFAAKGRQAKVRGELVLRMEREPRRWVFESLRLDEPELVPRDAPPPAR
jgi:hypothetical protein